MFDPYATVFADIWFLCGCDTISHVIVFRYECNTTGYVNHQLEYKIKGYKS